MRNPILNLLVAAALSLSMPVEAEPALSEASGASALATARVPSAAIDVLAAGGRLSVVALEVSGESAQVLVQGASQASRFSLRVSAETLRAAGVAAGTAVTVSAVSGGYLLSAAGEVLAFVPDALSRSMIHRRRVSP